MENGSKWVANEDKEPLDYANITIKTYKRLSSSRLSSLIRGDCFQQHNLVIMRVFSLPSALSACLFNRHPFQTNLHN